MNKSLDVIEIDDKSYIILKEVTNKDNTYLYLSNVNDEEDTLIRKIKENDIFPLENEKEFELACNLFIKEIAN